MKIVIDTSAIIAVIANEPEREALIAVTGGSSLLAPHSVYWEIGNAFSAMFKRGRVDYNKIKKALNIFQEIPIRFVDVELAESLQISEAHDCYCYDAYLLRCAHKHKSPLLTLNRKLAGIAKNMNLNIISVE